ncbi:MAG: V-type ATPase 116kDa subunit family protein, partial [Candidatus Bathyarchaeia archaeon]
MLKAEVCLHQDYVDSVLYSLGTRGLVEIDDIRPRLEGDAELKARVRPIEPSPLLFQLSSLSSRISALITTLGISEIAQPIQASGKALDDAALKEMSGFLDRLQEQVSVYQSKVSELEQAEERTPEAQRELSAAREGLRKVVEEHGGRLLAYRALVEPQLTLENVKTMMARTDATFIFQGWLRKENAEAFKELVEKVSEGNCFVALSPPGSPHPRHGEAPTRHGHEEEAHAETPPTLLRNPRIAGVYEKLVVAFGVPNYFEIDPSIFWLFSFPIIFGLMFGDLGQGAVLAALAFIGYLYKRKGVKG